MFHIGKMNAINGLPVNTSTNQYILVDERHTPLFEEVWCIGVISIAIICVLGLNNYKWENKNMCSD